jgi:hypothetical protein
MEVESTGRIDPVIDLVEMGQYADADRDTLLQLTIWLATSLRSCLDKDAIMALDDRGSLFWAPVRQCLTEQG